MRPGRSGMPTKSRAAAPVEIGPYLEYARENIEMSRILFKKGNLRYAVFSANEGLELCVKAHMLHYGIIDKAVAAGHFPYLAAVKKMREITKSIIKASPADKKRLELALGSLDTLERAFKMMMQKEMQVALWKLSLNIPLADGDEECLEKFPGDLSRWGKKIPPMESEPGNACEQDHGDRQPDGQADHRPAVRATHGNENGRPRGFRPGLPLGGEGVALGRVSEAKPLLALTPLIVLLDIISLSFAHQQISRYPTQIDGVDSRALYMANKDGVKGLLEKIYAASEMLSSCLMHGDPLLMQYAAGMGADLEESAPP